MFYRVLPTLGVLVGSGVIGSFIKPGPKNMPGANLKAYVTLPLRLAVVAFFTTLMFTFMLTAGFLRTLFLRVAKGKPSQILEYGTYPKPKPNKDGKLQCSAHRACAHYPCQQLYNQPLDEAKLKKVLVELAEEDGITEAEIELKFFDEVPNDWPATGSYDVTSALLNSYPKARGVTYFTSSPSRRLARRA